MSAQSVAEWKKEEVKELSEFCNMYPVVALIGIEGISAEQMQSIRKKLKSMGLLRVSRNTLIRLALDQARDGMEKLKEYVYGQTALFFTHENPFVVFKKMEESKTDAPLKPNSISPMDITIEKGPTPFRPGPVVGELQNVGIPAAIEKGKVVIKETRVVVKQGEKVNPKLAEMLAKLEIKPIKVGLDVRAIYEDGVIYLPETLRLDTSEYFNMFVEAVQNAINLSVNVVYPTEQTVKTILVRAHMDARNLAINAGIYEKDIIKDILALAYQRLITIVSMLPDEALDEDLKQRVSTIPVSPEKPKVEKEEKEAEEKEEEKEEEEEEKAEEEAIEGLGALFG
jgi:large subunit ribosomal protein L10